MYTIFVGNKPIILTNEISREIDFKYYLLKTVDISRVINELETTTTKAIYLVGKNKKKLLKNFLKLLPNVVAGGGKVYNAEAKILFIYRNDKWDLPKGKTERKESIEETAIREVEEETGVTGLTITQPLPITYHIFKRHGQHKIKITHWFEMKTNYSGTLLPQEKEGITKVKWLNEAQAQEALNNSYANIKLLI